MMVNTINIIRRNIYYLTIVLLLLLLQENALSEDRIVGWIEKVSITDSYITLNAKLDTGADTSSLNTVDEIISSSGFNQYITFRVVNEDNKVIKLKKRIVRWTKIKNTHGGTARRPVILLQICIDNISRVSEVNLIDRSKYKFQMLLGRNFLRGKPRLLVDSSSEYLHQPVCKK